MRILLPILVGLLSLAAVFAQAQDDPAEVAIGERLFLETRFAEFFARNSGKKELLDASLARFKTPGLRDLGHSGPYMHNRELDTLAAAVELYVSTSELQRAAALRNGAPQLADIRLAGGDVAPLAAFLRSLNEDYDQAMC